MRYLVSSQFRLLHDSMFHVADMSKGKSDDDGYRGVHLYFQKDNSYYPIEIQFNTLYDRQLNNWLHEYLYKKNFSDNVGKIMRKAYEAGKIKNVMEFEEVSLQQLCEKLEHKLAFISDQSNQTSDGELRSYLILKEDMEQIRVALCIK